MYGEPVNPRTAPKGDAPAASFGSRAQEAAVGILRTADRIRRLLGSTVEPFGLTLQQYNILRILRGSGEAMCTLEVSKRLIERSPGITRHLDILETKGLVVRERSTDDRREVRCAITADGRDLLRRMDPVVNAADEAAVAGLDDSSLTELVGLLDRIRSRLPGN